MTKSPSLPLLAVAALAALTAFPHSALRAQEPAQAPIEVEELPTPEESAPAAAPAPSGPGAASAAQGPLAVMAAPSESLSALEAEAQNAYADGDIVRALALYSQVGDRHPVAAERARLKLLAAWLAWQQNDQQTGRTYLESALFDDPQTPFRGDLYSPEFGAAYQDAMAAALAHRKQVAGETINRATTELRAGRLASARELLVRALALTPDDPDAVYNMALVDMRDGKDDAALAGFERVLSLERGNPQGVPPTLKGQSLNNAAVIYFARGEFADAERALTEAVALTSGDAKAWLNLGLARQKLGKSDESYEALKRARSLATSDIAIARAFAMAEVERSNWVSAVAILVDLVQTTPDDADIRLQLGRAQLGLGNAVGATESLRKAIELDPGNKRGISATATGLLADSLRAQGDIVGALAAAEQGVVLQPDDATAWLRLGVSRYERGDLGGALEATRKADSLQSGRADVAHNLGTVQMALKDYTAAEASFITALERDPANAEAKAALGRVQKIQADIARGVLARGELGATLAVAEYEALRIRGLRVDDVPQGSVAQRLGLQKGDLIMRVDGRGVDTVEELRKRLVGKKNPPVIDVLRQGVPVQIRALIP